MLKAIYPYIISLVGWLGRMTQMAAILLAFVVVITLMVVVVAIAFYIEPLIGISLAVVIVFLTVVMLLLSVRQVGSQRIPAYAILISLGRAVRAVGTGWVLVPFWYGKREFPAGQFAFQFIVNAMTKESEKDGRKLSAASVRITISVFMRWPDPSKEYCVYDENREKVRLWGEELLIDRAFYTVPADDLTSAEGKGVFRNHIEGAFLATVRHVVSGMNYVECNEGQQELEARVKTDLLREPGNPFHEMGIPEETLDVGIENIVFPEDIQEVLFLGDEASRKAEATKIHASGEAEATRVIAAGEAEAIRVRGESQAEAARAMSGKGIGLTSRVLEKLPGIVGAGKRGE